MAREAVINSFEMDGKVISTILIDEVYGIEAWSRESVDGSYQIFLNARYSDDRLRKAFKHEVDHILRGDFDRVGEDVSVIEHQAHAVEEQVEEVITEVTVKRRELYMTKKRKLDYAFAQKRRNESVFDWDYRMIGMQQAKWEE